MVATSTDIKMSRFGEALCRPCGSAAAEVLLEDMNLKSFV
ncbi:hypothetical protein AC519_1863 [Pseudomonas savastanoi]|nr:hypothetical protein AC519_1863 [Pseudomonas savastanoi]